KPYEPRGTIALDTNGDFPRWGSGIGRFGRTPPRAFRRREAHPRDPLPTPTEDRAQEGRPRSEGRPTASQSRGPKATALRPPQAPPGLEGPRATRDGGASRNCLGGPHPPRCRRPFTPDEPPPFLLASPRNPPSDRVQGRPRRRSDHQGQPCMDQQDLPSVWRPAPRSAGP